MALGLAEILKAASEIADLNQRVTYLQSNSSPALKAIVGYAYDPVIEWLIPETDPPYTPQAKEADLQNVLFAEIRRLRIFVNHNDYLNTNQVVRERNFIELLESVDPDDAKLLNSLKRREMPYPNLGADVFKLAFPTISKHW
jgi:hypothetical protein